MPGMDGGKNNEDVLADWMMSLIKTMRADMDSEKLYPPGSVYIIASLSFLSSTLSMTGVET